MDFSLNSEQTMLRDSVRQFVESECDFETRRKRIAANDARDRTMWSRFAELGWLAAALPEEYGGLGGSAIENVILLEELGRALVPEPFLATAVLSARAILASGSQMHRTTLLPAMAAGRLQVALAAYETASRYDLTRIETIAEPAADGYRLSGHKILVLGGGAADTFIVSARYGNGLALFVVDAAAPGVSRRAYRTVDDGEAADVRFDRVVLSASALLGGPDRGLEVLEEAVDHAIVGLCAELVGGMEKAIELTAAYLKQRKQFGRPLADFQVLQHRMADMFIETDSARSMVYYALSELDASPALRKRAVSACKVKVLEAAKMVTGNAIHNHGGIGMTLEYPVGHYFRHALVAEKLFGDADYHLQRYLCLENAADFT